MSLSLKSTSLFRAAIFVTGGLGSAIQYVGGSNFYWLAVAVLSLLVVANWPSAKGKPAVPAAGNTLFLTWLALTIWAALSLLWSASASSTALGLVPLIGFLIAFIAGARQSAAEFRHILWGLLLLGSAVALLTICQRFLLGVVRPTGTMVNWNSNGGFLAMVILAVAPIYIQQTRGLRLIVGTVAMLMAFAIGLTLSRGAFGALIIALLLFSVLVLRANVSKDALGGFVAFLGAGFALSILAGNGTLSLLDRAADSAVHPLSGRMQIWSAGWQMYLERPLLGWGYDVFWSVYPLFRHATEGSAGQNVHNDYLEALIELGPIGLGLVLAFVTALLPIGRRIHRKPDILAAGLIGSVAVLLIQATVTSNLLQLPFLLLAGLLAGQLAALTSETASVPIIANYRLVGRTVSALMAIWVSLVATSEQLCLTVGDSANALDAYRRLRVAAHVYPFWDLPYLAAADQTLSVLKEKPTLPADEKRRLAAYTLKQLDRGLAVFPNRPGNYARRAAIMRLADYPSNEVDASYRKALALDPFDLTVRIGYADFLQKQGGNRRAIAVLAGGWGRYYFGNLTVPGIFLSRLEAAYNEEGAVNKAAEAKELRQLVLDRIAKEHLLEAGILLCPGGEHIRCPQTTEIRSPKK